MKITSWVIVAAAVVLAIMFGCDIGIRPASWDQVHLGESIADLNEEFPHLHFNGHITADFYRLDELRVTGKWVTYYGIKNDRVGMRTLVFRIGTREFFKDFTMKYEEAPDWRR